MISENLHSWYYSYGTDGADRDKDTRLDEQDDTSQIRDQKHLFGFVWKNQPGQMERINGDRYFDHAPPPQSMDAFSAIDGSTPPIQYESYGFPSGNHPGGVNIAFCGGQVTFVGETIDPLVYAQLCTPNRNRSAVIGPNDTPERRLPPPPDNAY
jgi:prepilin-type processing-associated H-X9-DG protein